MVILKIILSTIIVVFLLMTAYFHFSNDPVTVIQVLPSKNNEYVVFDTFESGGGGAGWCEYGIYVRKLVNDHTIKEFLAKKQEKILSKPKCEKIDYVWVDDNNHDLLVLICAEEDDMNIKKNKFRDVNISYSNCDLQEQK